jgi:hypothetical protein
VLLIEEWGVLFLQGLPKWPRDRSPHAAKGLHSTRGEPSPRSLVSGPWPFLRPRDPRLICEPCIDSFGSAGPTVSRRVRRLLGLSSPRPCSPRECRSRPCPSYSAKLVHARACFGSLLHELIFHNRRDSPDVRDQGVWTSTVKFAPLRRFALHSSLHTGHGLVSVPLRGRLTVEF